MSVERNLDADAFMRKYLERPSDATARLVFADWLEETGEPHSAAWAHFIRLMAEADRYPRDSPTRYELERHAGVYAVQIRARLTVPAGLFVGYPKSLLQLLPATNITVSLARFEIPRPVVELMPESVARTDLVLPLDVQGRAVLLAAAEPLAIDLVQKLEFVLNRDVLLVAAEPADIRDALDRHYDATETESVTEELVLFPDTAIEFALTDPPVESESGAEPVARLVDLLITEAITRRADEIRFATGPDAVVVSHLSDGAWADRDHMARRYLRPVLSRLATMAWLHVPTVLAEPPVAYSHRGTFLFLARGLRYRVELTIAAAPDGPSAHLALRHEPVVVADL